MKEFENDHWEMKARQLADAFAPAPDEAVWLNLAAALKQKKNRRGIFFWLFSVIGVAVLVSGIYLFQNHSVKVSAGNSLEQKMTDVVAADIYIQSAKNSSDKLSEAENKTENSSEVNTVSKDAMHRVPTTDATNSVEEDAIIISVPEKVIVAAKTLDTVENQNAMIEKPDEIITALTSDYIIKPINPFAFCGFNFIQPILGELPSDLILGDHYRKKDSRWMLMGSASYMNQQSVLTSTDTTQTIIKHPTNYFDGSLHLIYQIPKLKNLELNFGLGFYEMTQHYSNSVVKHDTSTGGGVYALMNNNSVSGSEFYRSAFSDFEIGIPILAGRKLSWNISSGVRAEYLMKYSSAISSGNIPAGNFAFESQFDALQFNAAGEKYPLNRLYVKAMLNTSLRFSLSKHFALQSGINSSYAITDRYKKSSSLHQRDLNLGLNAGVLFRF